MGRRYRPYRRRRGQWDDRGYYNDRDSAPQTVKGFLVWLVSSVALMILFIVLFIPVFGWMLNRALNPDLPPGIGTTKPR